MASISHDLLTFHLVSANGTNATLIRAAAVSPDQEGVRLYGWFIYNANASARKVAFHDVSGTPTAGEAVKFSLVIPGNSAANVNFTDAMKFSAGLAITTTTGIADSDSAGVAANDLDINLWYK